MNKLIRNIIAYIQENCLPLYAFKVMRQDKEFTLVKKHSNYLTALKELPRLKKLFPDGARIERIK